MRIRLLLVVAALLLCLAGPVAAAGASEVDPKDRIEGVDNEERGLSPHGPPNDDTGIWVSLGVIALCSIAVVAVGLRPRTPSPGHPTV